MKFFTQTLVLAVILFLAPFSVQAFDWGSSPYNHDNSPYNHDNSPYNHKNSPYNYDNSPYKYGNQRIIRDNRGNPSGYVVPKSDGGANFFDFDGNRKGYVPSY